MDEHASTTAEVHPVRILHLDDSPFDAELVKMALDIEGKRFPATVKYVQTKEEFVAALKEKDFDVILSDYRMPGFDGDQALRLAQDHCPDIPFIMVTGELGEERVIETLQRGATDYVLKDRIFRLVPAIRRAIAEAENERKRKEAEEAVRQAHRRTSEILESFQDAFYSIDRHWQFTYINRKAQTLWGVIAESAIGHNVYSIFPHAAGSIGMHELELAMKKQEVRHFEFFSPVIHAWVDVHAYPTADGGLSVVFRDITERKKAGDILRDREQTLRSFYNSAPLLMGVAEPLYDEHDILHVYDNPAACNFFATESTSGKRASELGVPREAIDHWLQQYRACEERGEPVAFQYLHDARDGKRWLSSTVSFIGLMPNGRKRFSYVTTDITEQVMNEQAIRRQAKLIDLTPDAIIVRTVEGKIISWNKGAEELYGWKQEEVIGKFTHQILRTQFSLPFNEIIHELEARGHWKGELTHFTRDNKQLTVESRWLLYDDPLAGRLLMESNVDMTVRKRSELEREELLREVEQRRSLLRSVVERAPIGISILQGPEHRYIIINPAFAPFVAGKGEIVGRTVADVFPEVAGQIVPLLDNVYRTGESFQATDMPFTILRHGKQEETFFTFIYAPWYNEQEKIEGVMSLAVETTDQVRVRESIEQERERLSLAQRTGGVGVFDWNVQTGRVTWTPELEEIFGIAPGTFAGTYAAWGEFVHPDDLPTVQSFFDEWMKSTDQQDRQWEYRIINHQGEERWIAARARMFRGSEGKPVRVIGTNLDITEQKQAEEQLRASEARLHALAESLPHIVWTTDPAGNVASFNERWYAYTGLEKGREMEWQKVIHPDDLSRTIERRQTALRMGDSYEIEYRFRRHDGVYRWFLGRSYPMRDTSGQIVRWFGTATDIHDLKIAEERLRATTEKAEAESAQLQAILNNLNDGVVVADPTGEVLYLNPAAMQLHGYGSTTESKRVTGDLGSFFEVFDLEGNAIPLDQWTIPCVISGEEVKNSIRRVHRLDTDKWFAASYNGTGLFDSSGRLRLVIVTIRDVTAQIEAEEEVRRLNRELEERVQLRTQELEALNQELESFSYTVSHDLRSPLQVIGGYAELLMEDREHLSRQQFERLRHIVTNTERMQVLITALLDFARLTQEPLHETTVDMRSLVQAVVQEQRRSAGIAEEQITVDIHDLPRVQADPVLMHQVVANLVSNAFKYTRKSPDPRVEIGVAVEDGNYRFFVRDNGVGFPHDKATKLFGVFQRLHAQSEFEGTGIGLANVRKIIERHGGKVWAEGDTGKGASFFFTIPRKERLPKRRK